VILADSVNVAYADTLQQAIDQLVGTSTAPPSTTPTPTTFTPAQVAQVANLVTQANLHYAAAYAALKAGDLTTFANEMAMVGQLLQQLQQITGVAPTTTTTPSPSPRATATPTK
jgi:uncharacterized membrane protein (UPF0182 family)